jgi:hypothetical protein
MDDRDDSSPAVPIFPLDIMLTSPTGRGFVPFRLIINRGDLFRAFEDRFRAEPEFQGQPATEDVAAAILGGRIVSGAAALASYAAVDFLSLYAEALSNEFQRVAEISEKAAHGAMDSYLKGTAGPIPISSLRQPARTIFAEGKMKPARKRIVDLYTAGATEKLLPKRPGAEKTIDYAELRAKVDQECAALKAQGTKAPKETALENVAKGEGLDAETLRTYYYDKKRRR